MSLQGGVAGNMGGENGATIIKHQQISGGKAVHYNALAKAAASLVLTATALVSSEAQEKPPLTDPARWVAERVKLWQPVSAERRFDDIGWARDILEARRLAAEHNRPIFLFTHDGHMAIGRC